MKKEFASPSDNVKVLVCGPFEQNYFLDRIGLCSLSPLLSGPPPQLEAIAGKKDGMKQGALGGALKELGYKEEQVKSDVNIHVLMGLTIHFFLRYTSSRAKVEVTA